VERGLQRLAKPWHRLRAVSVFRDQSDLALTPGLWSTISTALDDSRYFILLACPESAASIWVNREVAHWCDTKGTDHLLVVVTGGELAWDPDVGDFSEGSTAVPAALRARFTEEPLYLDLRWARDSPELTLRLSRFRAAIAQIASPIRGLPPDELEGEDIRQHRRARLLARTVVVTILVLAVVSIVAAIIAVGNARRAERRAREALGRQLGLAALDVPAGELDQALLLSLAAADLQDDDDATRFQASRALIGRYSRLEALLHPAAGADLGVSFRGVAIDPSGDRIVATAWSPDGSAELLSWEGGTRTQPTAVAVPDGYSPSVAFVGDTGRIVLGTTGGSVGVMGEGGAVHAVSDQVAALDLAGGRALVMADDGALDLVDVNTGTSISGPISDPLPGSDVGSSADGPLFDLSGDRVVVASAARIVLLDASDGEELASSDDATPLMAIAVGPTEDLAVLGASADGTIRTWARDGPALAAGDTIAMPDEIGTPRRLVPSPDGRRVLVTADAGSALVNLTTGATESTDLGASGLVATDPSGRFAAIGGARLTVWDLVIGQRAFAVPEPANALAWSGRCDADVACKLVSAGESLAVWEPAAGRRVQLADQTNAQAVAISGDGSTVVTAGWGATVAVWKLTAQIDDTGRVEVSAPGPLTSVDPGSQALARYDGASTVEVVTDGVSTDVPTGPITGLVLTAGGSRLLVDGAGGLRLFATEGGTPVDLDARCNGDRFAVSPRGAYVVTYSASTGATVDCDTSTGTMFTGAAIHGNAEPVGAVAVDDNGDVALGGGDGVVEYYRADGGRFALGVAINVRLGGEAVEVTSLALRNGTIAAGIRPIGGRGAVARVLVWDAAGGGTPVQFDTDHRDVAAVGLLGPSADLVVVAGVDDTRASATLQVWEAETRRRLGRALGGLAGDVVMLGGDTSAVVGVDAGGRAFTWSLDTDPTAEICAIVGRSLSTEEWSSIADGALASQPYSDVCA
jgi:WD40 repeat protein